MGFLSLLANAIDKDDKASGFKSICRKYTNNKEYFKDLAVSLYKKRKKMINIFFQVVNSIEDIQNLPNWCKEELKESKSDIQDFCLAVKYENDPQKFAEETDVTSRTVAYIKKSENNSGKTISGGVAIKDLGPTAAMAIATVVAASTTGTTSKNMSNREATNAALAWMEGGIKAMGVGAGAMGVLSLGMFGVVGLTIAGIGMLSSAKVCAEVQKYSSGKEIEDDNSNLEKKLSHLEKLKLRSDKDFDALCTCFSRITEVESKDYEKWNDSQKHELERIVNTIANTVYLINERV